MPTWFLKVRSKSGDHEVPLSPNESDAKAALAEVQDAIGKTGTVVIAERLVLKAEDITSGSIERRSGSLARGSS